MIKINFEKAKDIRKEQLRIERSPVLAALDIEFQRNLEVGADNSSVIAEKNRLRDITDLVDEAVSIDDLLAIQVN